MNGVLQGLVSAGLLLVAACGDAPLPAAPPPPRAFDDPFADEAGASEPAGEVVGAAKIPADTPEPALLAEPREPAISPAAAAPSEPAAEAPSEPVAAAPATSPRPAKGKPRAGEGPAPKDTSPVASTASAPPVPADSQPPTPDPAPVAEPSPPPEPVKPPEPPQRRFAGTYQFVGGDAQRQALTEAIEATVQQLNALIRGIARRRITEANLIREQITIAVDGDKITTTFGPGRTVTGVLGGPNVPWTGEDGKPVSLVFSMVKGRLVQAYTSSDGGRRSVFTLDEVGDRMTLSVTISSDRLPNPLKYALTYRRGG